MVNERIRTRTNINRVCEMWPEVDPKTEAGSKAYQDM